MAYKTQLYDLMIQCLDKESWGGGDEVDQFKN